MSLELQQERGSDRSAPVFTLAVLLGVSSKFAAAWSAPVWASVAL